MQIDTRNTFQNDSVCIVLSIVDCCKIRESRRHSIEKREECFKSRDGCIALGWEVACRRKLRLFWIGGEPQLVMFSKVRVGLINIRFPASKPKSVVLVLCSAPYEVRHDSCSS